MNPKICFVSTCLIKLIILAALIFNTGHAEKAKMNTTLSPLVKPRSVSSNDTFHVFLLMVPNSDMRRFARLLQEEEGGEPSFAQTGEYLGQIIRGVLGGDIGPVLAGSAAFVEEPMAQANLGSFFSSIAPALNLALRELYTRAQVAFGYRTTPKPYQPTPATALPMVDYYDTEDPLNMTMTESANGTIFVGNSTKSNSLLSSLPSESSNGSVGIPARRQTQQQQRPARPQNQNQPQASLPSPKPTTSWEYVLNLLRMSTTTVEPLPFLTSKPSGNPDEDDYEAREVPVETGGEKHSNKVDGLAPIDSSIYS